MHNGLTIIRKNFAILLGKEDESHQSLQDGESKPVGGVCECKIGRMVNSNLFGTINGVTRVAYSIGRLESLAFRIVNATRQVVTEVIFTHGGCTDHRYNPEKGNPKASNIDRRPSDRNSRSSDLDMEWQAEDARYAGDSSHAEVERLKRSHQQNQGDPFIWDLQAIRKYQEQNRDSGLTNEEAQQKLNQFGWNETRGQPGSIPMFLHQFANVSTVSLLGFGVLALFLGKYIDAAIVFFTFLLSGVLTTRYKGLSEQAHQEHLRKHKSVMALREGRLSQISSHLIVPGDLIFIRPGDMVPADGILLQTNHFELRELASDASYQWKTKKGVEDPDWIQADWAMSKRNLDAFRASEAAVYAGSVAIRGTAKMLVTATGKRTRYSQLLQQPKHQQMFTEKHYHHITSYLTKYGWLSILAIGAITMLLRWSGTAALQTAVAVGTSVIPGGLSLPVCLAYWSALKKSRKTNGMQGLPSMHHVDKLEDSKGIILSEHGITKELNIQQLWCANTQWNLDQSGTIGAKSVWQAAALYAQHQTAAQTSHCSEPSLYDQAIQRATAQFGQSMEANPAKWIWIHHGGMQDHELFEMRVFKDENGRLIEVVRGPAGLLFQACAKAAGADQDLASIDTEQSLEASVVEDSFRSWLHTADEHQACTIGFACRVRDQGGTSSDGKDLLPKDGQDKQDVFKSDLIWIGAFSMKRTYQHVQDLLYRCKERKLPVFLLADFCMAEDSDFWKAIDHKQLHIKTVAADKCFEEMSEQTLGHYDIWVIHGNDEQRLQVVHTLRERMSDVCFIGCQEQERAYFGAAWMSIEQGVLRGLKDVIHFIEEAQDARSRLSRANGMIISGNFAEAVYTTMTGILGLTHAHGPINLNILTNLITSIGIAIGGQRNGEAKHAQDFGELKKPILSHGVINGLIATSAYGIGLWIRTDPMFASTFAFATLILSQLIHALKWGRKEHVDKLAELTEETVMVVSVITALGILIVSAHTPAVAQMFRLTPLALHEWLAAAAIAGVTGPIAAKIEQPIWRGMKRLNPIKDRFKIRSINQPEVA
ncbi:cation transporting ATPase C-terminal domain-containing protein [Fodinisporobacter ferrooxydans]|uniref:Cation transporting ATPase C-terminal domain-containing protein n=1 Tax=Fodinisporobacter ferrooxydans TaxID=2901836 RepID=A0ABY4CS30_9BACL|nr:cation transporting ATPase C-terminal domain-containing protein [Alicyclobacillaceae bacterium MYW30-H2]